jgi:hypothetical protein
MTGNFGGRRAEAAAARLEAAGRDGLRGAGELLRVLRGELQTLQCALGEVGAQPRPS